MRGVCVALASGENFYIADVGLDEAAEHFRRRQLVRVGGRWVNGSAVAQLSVQEIPSVEVPEHLEAGHGAVVH